MVLPYVTHGVQLYGNVNIASPKLIAKKPEAVRAFFEAFAKGAKEAMASPEAANAVWNGSFLPSAAELDILPKR